MQQPEKFCRFLKNGLLYNNDTTHFTVSPCCYFGHNYYISPKQSIDRSQWLNVDLNNACRLCLELEASGIPSYRQASFDQVTGATDSVEFLTVAVNKICNLACPSCNAGSSSFWYQENLRNNQTIPESFHALHQEDRAGIATQEFINRLQEIDLSQLTYIKFGGGEPLMSDTHQLIMELIPNPGQVTLHYTSNFSIMPSQEIFNTWEKFKLVKWVASIDGYQDQFELLRWPHTWKKLTTLVKQAKASVPGNVMFGVEHTLNPLNIFYFDQFYNWFQLEFSVNRLGDTSDFNLHACHGTMALENTPPELRKLIKEKYGVNHNIVRLLDQYPYSGCTKDMVEYLDQLDQQRNQNWRNTFSEIEAYFD